MATTEPYDSRFTMPDVDGPPGAEIGVILLGLDVERLAAGLGFARFADDPGLVTQAVDQARHGVFTAGLPALVAAGIEHWRMSAPRLAAVPVTAPVAGSVRQEWALAERVVDAAVPGAGAAMRAHLTACWLRRDELDRLADRKDPFDVVPEVPAG